MTDLQEAGLVESFDEPSDKLGRPRKFYKLTELGRKLVAPFIEVSKAVELLDPDVEEIELLIQTINSGSTKEAKKAAMKDLIDISTTTRVWKLKIFQKFLDEAMAQKSTEPDVLDLVRVVRATVMRDGDKKTARSLLERYGDRVVTIVLDPAQNRELRFSALLTYTALEQAGEARHSDLMRLTESLMENEPSDEEFNNLKGYLSSWLEELWKTNRKHARKWLLGLMQVDNERVAKRAVQLRHSL
jgi:predicted transcriptional regulator